MAGTNSMFPQNNIYLNPKDFVSDGNSSQHFPSEGLYLGALTGGDVELPARYDFLESKGLCFLYNGEQSRKQVNACLERLAWRIALTVPSNLCELVMFNGGNPGEVFNHHIRINNYLFGNRRERLYFDGNTDAFRLVLSKIYASIVERMSSIQCAGKQNLVEYNESLGNDARLKYQFIFLSDFPRHIQADLAVRLSQIIESGSKAGIYVIMSCDMNADFEDVSVSSSFDFQKMMMNMELLVPNGGKFVFRNSGHDDILNRFRFAMDCEPVGAEEAEKILQKIDIQVEVAKKLKPTALKPDFSALISAPYSELDNEELTVTVGLDVSDKHPVNICFSPGDYIHGFILGQSGSGKSVLLNTIITSAILKYSPADLMLYLMDFKGVEFNRYRGEKHTKAVLVDNRDPQMTLEVLRELNEENRRRQNLFHKASYMGVDINNIKEYHRKFPKQRLPQILFVADECQVMFKSATSGTERIIQQEINSIIETLATQGRSQGIHMLFATQQLDDADIPQPLLKNLTECFLLMSAPADSERLVPDSSNLTSNQMTGLACYYHKKQLQGQVQTFYSTNEELREAIDAAQAKAEEYPGNGGHYFCGSSAFNLSDDVATIENNVESDPVILMGRSIGIDKGATSLLLKNDFYENLLVFGVNKEQQSTSVIMNALASLIRSYGNLGRVCDFIVIDCLSQRNSLYGRVLEDWASRGLIRLVPRTASGPVLEGLVSDLKAGLATDTILTVVGSERFIEIRKKMPLLGTSSSVNTAEVIDGIEMLSIDPIIDISGESAGSVDVAEMTFPQALLYILEEGPLHGVHTLLQVDKPQNILFDDYDMSAADKFRHRVILKSENKHIQHFRFSHEIDVESLNDEMEHLRAYYYPDGDEPVLFTPYQMLESDIL